MESASIEEPVVNRHRFVRFIGDMLPMFRRCFAEICVEALVGLKYRYCRPAAGLPASAVGDSRIRR
ncbi:unnamed protein product [Pylaiella littoralis]